MVSACLALLLSITVTLNQHPVYGENGELLTGVQTATASAIDRHGIRNMRQNGMDSVPDFRPSIQIDDSTLLWCRGPFLHVLEDNTIYTILQSGPSSGLPRYIRFTTSSDTGQTWLDPNVVIRHDPNVIIGYPSMSVGQDNAINVIWTEPYNSGILFSRSIDNGLSWTDTVSVDDGLPSGYRRLFPDIICIGDSLMASWTEGPSSSLNWYPWASFSTDSGITWGDENQIDCVPVNTSSNWPRTYCRFDPLFSMFYVLWPCNDGEIYVARSPNGTSWQSSTVTIDNVDDANYPSMDVGPDGTVYVIWNEARFGQFDTDIFMSMSTDSGVTWSNSILVNDRAGLGDNQYEAHISIDKHGIIHVSWIECIPFGYMTHAYYTQSIDNGSTWVEPNLVVTDIPYTITPSVPYSISLASDTSSYGYVGWCYNFGSAGVLNFFSTNCPVNVAVDENEGIRPPSPVLSIYPNPFTAVTRLRLRGSSNNCNSPLQIYNASGRLVKCVKLATSNYKLGADLSPGVYFLKMGNTPLGKVVKVR